MFIKRLLISLVLLSSVFCSPLLSAQDKKGTAVQVELPNPMNLKTNWWDYFIVEGKNYKKHAEAIKEELEKILEGLESEQKDQAAVLIKRLSGNMEAYAEVRQEKGEKPAPKPFLDSYSLQQQIDVAKQVSYERSLLDSEKKEAKFLSNRLSKLSNHLDKLIVSYQEMKENNFQKLIQGLEILNTRFTVAINKEKLRVTREKIDITGDQLDNSEEELNYARKHIDYGDINIAEIESELSSAKQELEKTRHESLQHELKALPVTDNSLSGKLKGSLQQLKEHKTSVKELAAELAVLMQQIKLGIGSPPEDIEQLEKDYESWSSKLANIKDQKSEWEKKNEEELNRFKSVAEEEPSPDNEIENLQAERIKLIQENRLLLQQVGGKIFTTGVVLEQFGQIIQSQKSPLSRWWSGTLDSIENCCTGIIAWYNQTLFKIGEQPITVKNIVKALLVLIFTYFVSYFVRQLLSNAFRKKTNVSHGFIYSINRLIHYVILTIGLVIAMTSIGLDFDRIFIVVGALSVGIGFGLQSIVNNFVCGLIILFTRNIKVGDYIEMNDGHWGSVSAIHVQNTIIRTWDGTDIVIPNSTLVSERYTNWTRRDPYKRFHIPFCVAFGTDKEKIEEAAIKAALNVPATVGKAQGVNDPQCWLVDFGENGLMFELVVWTNVFRSGNHGSVKGSFYWELESAITECGFQIPYPKRDIYVKEEPSCQNKYSAAYKPVKARE